MWTPRVVGVGKTNPESLMRHLDLQKLRDAEVKTNPFNYLICPYFLPQDSLKQVIDNFPSLKGGSYPLDQVEASAAFHEVIGELDKPEFEQLIEEKFDVELKGRPKMYSLRGYCRKTDGKIHPDSKDKIITVLLYLNDTWHHEGGRLRLLSSATDLNAVIGEVPPDDGTLLIFKRADNSWHGHEPFEGPRRSIQMNWMTTEGRRGFHSLRHKLSAQVKKLSGA